MKPQPSATGVAVAPLGLRFGAAVLDRVFPALIGGVWSQILGRAVQGWLIYSVALALALFAWTMVQWWAYGTRKAGLGYRVFKLELVGLTNGKPIGWGRMALRTLVSYALWALVVPGVVMAIFLVVQERRQGWHDLAAGSLAITRRRSEPAPQTVTQQHPGRRATTTVGLPPHLLDNAFAARPPAVASAPISEVPLAPGAPQEGGTGGVPRFGPPSQPAPPTGQVPAWTPPAQSPSASPVGQAPAWTPPAQPPSASPVGQAPAWTPPGQPPAASPRPAMPGSAGPDSAQPTWQPGARPLPQPVAPAHPDGHPRHAAGQPALPADQVPGRTMPGTQPMVSPAHPADSQPPTHSHVHRPPQSHQPSSTPSPGAPSTPQPLPPPGTVVPSAGGSMAAASVVAPSPASKALNPPLRIKPRTVPSDEEDGTRLVTAPSRGQRPPTEGWRLRLDDGREVALTGLVLIGRAPEPRPGESVVNLVSAGAPDHTVSKTHAALDVDAKGPYLVDRGSTNGTAVLTDKGELEPCVAHSQVRLREGQVISFGERQLQLVRQPARRG